MDDHDQTPAESQNKSAEHQLPGDAQRPSEHLDKGRTSQETIPRKSSLMGND
jgi:hypothetical protein